jgi:hypothetical protein
VPVGTPARSVVLQYVSGLTIPFGVGLVLLRRESETLNAGVFLDLGLVNALGVVSMLITGPDVLHTLGERPRDLPSPCSQLTPHPYPLPHGQPAGLAPITWQG